MSKKQTCKPKFPVGHLGGVLYVCYNKRSTVLTAGHHYETGQNGISYVNGLWVVQNFKTVMNSGIIFGHTHDSAIHCNFEIYYVLNA